MELAMRQTGVDESLRHYDSQLGYPHTVPHTFDMALAIGDTEPTYQNATQTVSNVTTDDVT